MGKSVQGRTQQERGRSARAPNGNGKRSECRLGR
jgi:hypothetical protein